MQRPWFALIFVTLLLAISAAGFAAQTLVIDLNAPQESDLKLNHETSNPTQRETERKYVSHAGQSGDTSRGETNIGSLGVIAVSSASIKRTPSRRSANLFVCPKDTYLAIQGTNGAWYGVLMSDASTGWVEKSKVNLLNYQVTGQVGKSSSSNNRVVNTALKYLGIPYKWGGYSFKGLDCSGFVKAVYASHGVTLPRVARDQARVGMAVGWKQLEAGDRLYFACKGGPIDHAGIYIGNGYFIHSSTGRGGVAVDSIMKRLFFNSLVAARR